MSKPVLGLDGDNVLLDYCTAYARAWERAFGEHPVERDPAAYWPIDRWSVQRLVGEPLQRFRSCFDATFWSTMAAVDGALEAAHALHDAGFALICVSALEPHFESARLRNLRALGFPIELVVATGADASTGNPKAAALTQLNALALVDDYLPYLRGLPASVHTALVLRQPNGSPNVGPELASVGSQHADLRAFAQWWLAGDQTTPTK
jgi:phosphoglycolate phosphatase-like HAD superfamily hydrolase